MMMMMTTTMMMITRTIITDKYCFSYMPVSFYASCFKLASVTFDVSRTSRHIPPCEFKLYHLAILHRRNYSLDLHSDIHWSHQLFSHPKQDILATRASYDVHPSKRTDQTKWVVWMSTDPSSTESSTWFYLYHLVFIGHTSSHPVQYILQSTVKRVHRTMRNRGKTTTLIQ